MGQTIAMFGYGQVGRATVPVLQARGFTVDVAQRSLPAGLPEGVAFTACDVMDAEAVRRVVAAADQVVLSVGLPYDGRVWREGWPRVMGNVLQACEAAKARLVFVDNLYMYGPQDGPLREDTPLTSLGVKPAVRAQITRQWMGAAGRVRVAALRPPDFYGPGVGSSHLGASAFGALARGKRATLLVPPDLPHAMAYVPDIARAVATLLEAPDEAYGQAWHVPCAPTRTPREILQLGAAALGVRLRLTTVPLALLPLIGLAWPFAREVAEMGYTWDRPYRVDAGKFARRFWSDATPFEVGAAATARSFAATVGVLAAGRPGRSATARPV